MQMSDIPSQWWMPKNHLFNFPNLPQIDPNLPQRNLEERSDLQLVLLVGLGLAHLQLRVLESKDEIIPYLELWD